MPYAVIDADSMQPAFRGVFKEVRLALGVRAFGINEAELPPDAQGGEHGHRESRQEEVFLVLQGAGTMIVDDEEIALRPGRYVFVTPEARRQLVAGPEGLSWVVTGAPVQENWEPQILAS
jgi:mannose-6-phosphate isomerase-like protein (cupin superfamily)